MPERKNIAKNRRAFHDYSIDETFEAGIELTGTEVRSLRESNAQITDTFALVRRGEVWLHGMHIAPYSHGNRANGDPDRKRRLLLHKKQIRYLEQKTKQDGMTLVPLNLYFAPNGLVKVELGLAKGKKNYDKRASMAERDSKREVERALKARVQDR
ncbi:MAG: SsrA-binding protein SmpB [Coriobacteriales bacterium]|jgi:SsrA-binding protein|nr:SsrA-binding protein SmpB [Coriobacteriales bacterium]